MKAIVSTTRITPRKANLVAHMIRKRPTTEALEILKFMPKKAGQIIFKLLTSAVANAVNNFKQDQKTLFVKQVIVNRGPTLKRSVPVSRGRSYPILKRTSHITIELGLLTALPASDKAASQSTTPELKEKKKAAAKKTSTKKSTK